MKRIIRLASFAAVASLVSSCMDMTTEIHVKPDGSATVSQAVYMAPSIWAMMQQGDPNSLINEAQLKAKAAQMGKGVTYLGAKEVVRQDSSKGYVARYGVKHIDDLTLKGSALFTAPGKDPSPSESADDEPLWKFRFTPGRTASLAVEMVEEDGGQVAEERDGAYEQGGGQADVGHGEQAAEDAMATEIMKLMFEEMRMWVHVRVDGTITESNAQYMHPEPSGFTLLKIDFGKLLADEKGAAQLQALGKQPKPEDMRTRFAHLKEDLPYLQIENQKVVKVKFESAPSETAVQRRQPRCQEWNTEEFFRDATGADVQYCLDMGMNVNARDYGSSPTPLHFAAQFGTPASITALIDAGATIEATATYGESGGAYNSHVDFTPLHAAAMWGTPANMKALIDAGTNVHAGVLDWVAARGTPSHLKVLIDAGADVRAALHAAVYGGPAKIALLLDAGADIKARDRGGGTPLHAAASSDAWNELAVPSIKVLLDAGADIEARDAAGRTPLHLAAAWNGGPARIEALLAAGADIGARSQDGWTPLHLAASMAYDGLSSGDRGSLTALLDAGANIEARDAVGRTPLHVAALHVAAAGDGLPSPVEALLEAGADIEARDKDGSSALHLAAGVEYRAWASNNITILLDAGASIEARDNDGRTPLHIAAGMGALPGHPDNVTILLEAGADGGARDNDGRSPFKLAPSVGTQIALQPHEYDVWEGEWIRTDSNLENNYYSILRIQDVDDRGFTYSSECRDIPYGPNAMWSDEGRASFGGPFSAANPATGASFSLRVNPDDRHDRVMEMNPVQCSHTDAVPDSVFIFSRSVYRAGFDCDKAATPVETTICHNQLLAQGDLEMSLLYRALLEKRPALDVAPLRSAQRVWLKKRNRDCLTGDAVDEVCLARLYSDRLAALAKLQDPSLGAEPLFDAAYALALVIRDADLRQDTATRLAIYPLVMEPQGTVAWQADDSGLLFEQTWVKTKVVWPADVDFRYSEMLFVGSKGTVWTAAHVETVEPVADEFADEYLWRNAGRDPLTVWSETGGAGGYPLLMETWLKAHPVPQQK